MTAAIVAGQLPERGLRPFHLQRDLGQVADLIELCFASTLDESGRGAIREMRALSRFGPLVGLLSGLTQNSPAWQMGFVWVEGGRVVGNLGTQRSPRRGEWLIANVAVHPDYRRRGLARELTQAALELARKQGGSSAILQVDDDNAAGLTLYADLGFQRETTRAIWTRQPARALPSGAIDADPASDYVLRPRRSGEWQAEYTLASLALPHGLAWNQPLTSTDFRPTLTGWLDTFFAGQREEHWLAEESGARFKRPVGAVAFRTGVRGADRIVLLAHPEVRGKVERPLMIQALRRLGRAPWPTQLEFPADDRAAGEVFKELGFSEGRKLVWMRAML